MFALALAFLLQQQAPARGQCDWATAADASRLAVRAASEEATEIRNPKRIRPDDPWSHVLSISVTRHARGPRCLRVGWRVVPRGKPAATAADFIGGRWPSGMIDLPAWPTSREPNPPSVEISFWPRDDDIAEMNETLGVELLDRHGRVIWGSETWAPEILGRSVLWYWSKNHPNGVILTIHDAGHQCSIPGLNSGFSIVNKRERREYRQYWRWPGLFVDRPERPIVQCEVLRWRLSDGGARPLRASDFAGGRFPGGTLRYSSDATGGPEEDDTQPIRFKLRRGVSGRGRTVKITLETSRGVIAQSVQTLK